MIGSNPLADDKKVDKKSRMILAAIIILLFVALMAIIGFVIIANK
jgi:hypothetical protein